MCFEANPHRKGIFQENSSFTFPIKKLISHAKIVFIKNKVSSELESNSTFFFLKAKFLYQSLQLNLKKNQTPPRLGGGVARNVPLEEPCLKTDNENSHFTIFLLNHLVALKYLSDVRFQKFESSAFKRRISRSYVISRSLSKL